MNEGQNDNLIKYQILATHKPARTISSALVQYVYMKMRETEKSERDRQRGGGREREG